MSAYMGGEEWEDLDPDAEADEHWLARATEVQNFAIVYDPATKRGFCCPWIRVGDERMGQPFWNSSPEFWKRLSLAAIDISTKLKEAADGTK